MTRTVMTRPVRRRTVLGAALTLPALAGCSVTRRPVEVLVSWSGTELDTFRRIVADFQHATRIGVQVDVVPGNEVDAALNARVRAGNPPDLAVFTEPGLIHKYRRHLVKLDHEPVKDVPAYWNRLARGPDGNLYGYWLKAAHKSLLWHRRGAWPPLDTWDQLVAAAKASPTPLLSIGAADGWVLTDWFENLLAGLADHDEYESLAAPGAHWHRRAVRDALGRLGDLWALPGLFPGGPGRAMLTAFDASVADVFGTGRARLVFEGDFVRPVITSLGTDLADVTQLRFPRLRTRPLVVGGDVIVALYRRTHVRWKHTHRLLTYLVSLPIRKRWVRRGFLVPSTLLGPDDYRAPLSHQWAEELAAEHADPLFDLSDRLSGRLAGDDGKGTWLIMQDFFRAVTGGVRVPTAVRDTCDALHAAARATRP